MGHQPSDHESTRSYIVLRVAFVLKGASLVKALRQLSREAQGRQRGLLEHLRKSKDPTVKTVSSEHSTAVAGLSLAATGLEAHQVTGSAVYDAADLTGV